MQSGHGICKVHHDEMNWDQEYKLSSEIGPAFAVTWKSKHDMQREHQT